MAKIVKGEVRNPKGRPEGSVNVANRLRKAFDKSFVSLGEDKYLETIAHSNPAAYLNLGAKFIPSEQNLHTSNATSDNLEDLLTYLKEQK